MIKIDKAGLETLKKCIGRKVNLISSSRISWSEYEISFPNRELVISLFDDHNFELKSVFFENERGEMFHDYEIKECMPYRENISSYTINSEVINKIEIYGRLFPVQDFKNYSELYQKFKNIVQTDDVFVFYLSNGERFMIVMHDYVPEINLYVYSKSINFFFDNTRSVYSLHHTL